MKICRSFAFDVVLEEDDICNLINDRKILQEVVKLGHRLVFFGRRNTGKTSLLKSIIIPYFAERRSKGLSMYVDLMNVSSEEDVCRRMTAALEASYARSKPSQKFLNGLVSLAKSVRPQFSIDCLSGVPTFSFGLEGSYRTLSLEQLFTQIALYHKEVGALIIIDEFQDISEIDTLPARMRSVMQNLPSDLPVIISGSKKHILSKMFADPKAPFSSWGRHHEIGAISVDDYLLYANERFEPFGISFPVEACEYLMKRMNRIPEPMNMVCDRLTRISKNGPRKEIQMEDIEAAISLIIEERSPLFIERITRFTEKEQRFLKVLSDLQIIALPTGKLFLRATGLSAGGCSAILNRLEDQTMIYREPDGYILGDPLLAEYLRLKVR